MTAARPATSAKTTPPSPTGSVDLLTGVDPATPTRAENTPGYDRKLDRATTTRSANQMIDADKRGPIFAGRRAEMRRLRPGTLRPLLAVRDRVLIGLFTAAWVVAFVAFWVWWLQPEHRVGWFGLVLNTALLFYLAYMPIYFMIAVNRLPGVAPDLPVPDLRVAFLVTKAPSEPWDVARNTLQAMLSQRYPYDYDVWLCDENPSEQTRRWCADNGVHLSTRYGVTEYHRAEWPRRTKCKEGNVAYFYDHWGYRDYDVAVQLDCDHVPTPTYLAEMVRPFSDPAVGYVAAPSMNDLNARESWSNRGRIHKEGTFHGAFQTGHNGGYGPVCIGSHYAVRTAALQQVGGIGPELAEDFSTSFMLNAGGWHGVFAHRAEAHGEGPPTFSAMLTQEYQWSRSLVTVLFDNAPRQLPRMPWKLRLRFTFALSYYPLLALTTSVGVLLPAVAALTGAPWVNVNYIEFLIRWSLISVWLLLITGLVRRRGLLRPTSVPLVSWENFLYTIARWPYIVWGVLAAIRMKLQPGRTVQFKVTPKGGGGPEKLPTRLLLPYAGISMVLSISALVGEFTNPAFGYVFLSLVGSLSLAVVCVAVPLLHAKEAAAAAFLDTRSAIRQTVVGPLILAAVVWIPLLAGIVAFPSYVAPLLGYFSPLSHP